MSVAEMQAILRETLADIPLSAAAIQQLAEHWQLVSAWNARTNLTALTAPQDAAWLHYRDSLAGLAYLQAGPVVDFGTGGGFPGVPLAIARPDWQFTLVEPRRKRASFLTAAIARLALPNVRVFLGRLQDAPDTLYAHAVTRATFSDDRALAAVQNWLQPHGTLLAYRRSAAARPGIAVHPYELLGQARCIEIWRFAAARRCD